MQPGTTLTIIRTLLQVDIFAVFVVTHACQVTDINIAQV